MSSSTISPYTYAYNSIQGIQEYIDFNFSINWVSIFTILMLSYTIPSILVFFKIAFFYFVNRGKIKKIGLRMEIFQSFLMMQFWNVLLLIGEFPMFRIPYTTIFSQYCAAENPQHLLRFIVFFYHFMLFSSQLFTVMFCGLRVAILYNASRRKTEKVIQILPFFIISIGFLLALPHYLTYGVCMQVFKPYPFGSILIISNFHLNHLEFVVPGNVLFTGLVTISIIVLTYFMLKKVQERKRFVNSPQSSSQTSKTERTLTITMHILLVPLILNVAVSIGELFHVAFFSYILLIRPLFLDARVHIVTCYFYLTHPVFRHHEPILPQVNSLSQNLSRVTLKTVE